MQPFDLSNPYRLALMKYASDLLGDRFPRYQEILLRISNQIVTQKDAADFTQMLVDLFERGFLKAVDECKKVTEGQGIKIRVVPTPSQNP